jgi:Arm DNA-binding domain/Phage integrase, N-terminal SAM-like domain
MQRQSNASVAALATTGRNYLVFDTLSGFAIRITPAGSKLFFVQARIGGAKRRITLGSYPDMKVAEARDAARLMLDDIRAGKNPVIEREIRREAITAGDITVAELADRWMIEVVLPKRKPRTIDDYQRIIAQRIKPELGDIPVRTLTWASAMPFTVQWLGRRAAPTTSPAPCGRC